MTWLAPGYRHLFDKYFPSDWKYRVDDQEVWESVDKIPDEELWKTHKALKAQMIRFIRERLKKQYIANGVSLSEVNDLDNQLDTEAITIGFAKRFATYKRADLIFRDLARIERILNSKGTPVQIIFAGKAHPADRPAHELIKSIHDIAKREGFRGRIFLVENYNMTMARYLVQGVDVWLNNPRRPLEASGTSGMKAGINGVINFSIVDGWWDEGYNGRNGWVIGDDTPYNNDHHQDDADSKSLYETLEREIIPLYYNCDEKGIPTGWIRMMKESIKSVAPVYGTQRMVKEYTRAMYAPCMDRVRKINESDYSIIRELAEWKGRIESAWPQVALTANQDIHGLTDYHVLSDQEIRLSVTVQLGTLNPGDVSVEVFYAPLSNDRIIQGKSVDMSVLRQTDSGAWHYEATLRLSDGGEYGYTFRVIPRNPNQMNKYDLPLVKWA